MNRREFLQIAPKALVGVGTAMIGLSLDGCMLDEKTKQPKETKVKLATETEEARLRRVVLAYLAQPEFTCADLMEQVSGTKATLERYNLDEKMLYFSIPSNAFDLRSTLPKITNNPQNVEFGEVAQNGLEIVLGNYRLIKPWCHFFRFLDDDFRLDKTKVVRATFGSDQYTISLHELADFADNERVYGGRLFVSLGSDSYGRIKALANHGAFVGVKGEPSLEKFVVSLVSGRSTEEQRIQRLLDFVTSKIHYDESTKYDTVETLQKPNEVLLSKRGDCSGKVILFASLLEQLGTDYYVLYYDGHASVAVNGNFRDLNESNFRMGDKKYFRAETTAPGFIIGRSRLLDKHQVDGIRYMQKPGPNSRIIEAATGKVMDFL